ncbi:unnamed protein product [Peronospora belbahrii]|uniref:Uncharacterized protein n=1 Tax=Peronospora belbahrii TaxID=622444 RepID=A0ABN8CW32_9STRA|nr:unnamed protein product [Peronospora belbahrii]
MESVSTRDEDATNCGFGLLYVNIPVATCRERNADRSDGARVPHEVFERMVTTLEAATGHQISWEVNTWEVNEMDNAFINARKVMDALVQQAYHELKDRRLVQTDAKKKLDRQHRDQQATQQNVLHLVDLQLRRWIATRLHDEKTPTPEVSKLQLAYQLNQRRKSYLASLKHSYSNVADRSREQRKSVNEVDLLVNEFKHWVNNIHEYYVNWQHSEASAFGR